LTVLLQGMTFDIGRQTSGEKPCRACTDFKDWLKSAPSVETKKEQLVKAGESAVGPVVVNPPAQPQAEKQSSLPTRVQESSVDTGSKLAEVVDQAAVDRRAGVCPPDRSGLGSATWTFLHSVAAYFPATPR
jgi:hypothetical protein